MTLTPPENHAFSIGAQKQEVMFRDGTSLTLHPVFDHGTPTRYHRALHLPNDMSMIIDLRSLVPSLGADLCAAADRDVPGIVFYTLRHHYTTAELVVRAVCTRGSVLPNQPSGLAASEVAA